MRIIGHDLKVDTVIVYCSNFIANPKAQSYVLYSKRCCIIHVLSKHNLLNIIVKKKAKRKKHVADSLVISRYLFVKVTHSNWGVY